MLLIKNAHIKTMAGGSLEKGCLLIGDDGKIVSVGAKAYMTLVDGKIAHQL